MRPTSAIGKTIGGRERPSVRADRDTGRTRSLDSSDRKGHNQRGVFMRTTAAIVFAVASSCGLLVAQENKPVPKDSVRVFVPGCTKGYIFTAGRRTQDEPGSVNIPEGMHLRMNGPKKMMAEIKAHEGSMIGITGLMKKGQRLPDGVSIGGGVRISPGPESAGGSVSSSPGVSQIWIDVEGWRPVVGDCPPR
jgi:hypothetical protein